MTPVLAGRAVSQEALDSYGLLSAGRYLPRYLELKALYEEQPSAYLEEYVQTAAFIGAEDFPSFYSPGASEFEAPFVAEPALQAIVEAAASTRIVILNEAHHVPFHRYFLGRVAAALRPLGYSAMGAEAFTPPQTEPTARIEDYKAGEPFLLGYGFYTMDPVFAETVREMRAAGYDMFSYEQREDQKSGAEKDRRGQLAAREEAQASNIADALHRLPSEAKILVYCGFEHATERGDPAWMAQRLKDKTGVDPLTIDQSGSWSPEAKPARDPNVQRVLQEIAPTQSVVVRDQKGPASPWYRDGVDLAVYHPGATRREGRPNWWLDAEGRKVRGVRLPVIKEVSLLQAYPAVEQLAGPPSDQVLVEAGKDGALLSLRPGHYLLQREMRASTELIGSLVVE